VISWDEGGSSPSPRECGLDESIVATGLGLELGRADEHHQAARRRERERALRVAALVPGAVVEDDLLHVALGRCPALLEGRLKLSPGVSLEVREDLPALRGGELS